MSAYAKEVGKKEEVKKVTFQVSKRDEEMLDWYVAELVGEGA